jgi:4-amino-4-deoxy-L-arabinose transferase-like glycosyltransferase
MPVGWSLYHRRLLFACGAALAFRLFYIFVIAPEPIGVGGDASFYHSAANLIAQGHFFYRRIFGHAYPTALHPPLYSILLTPVALLGGVHLLPQRLVGLLLGTVNVGLIGVLGRRISGSDRGGLIAAGIAAVYPPFITADGSIMSEPLYVFLLLAALLLATRLLKRPSLRGAGALGAIVGLGVLTRTEAVLWLPFLAWPAIWRGGPKPLIAATAAAVIVVSPWVIRNEVVFHKFELAANADTVIVGANCHETYYGNDIGWWSDECVAHARTHHQLLIGDANPSPGFRYAEAHPARAVLVAGVRLLRTFSFWQPLRIGNHEPRRKWFDALGLVIYYPLLVLTAIGLYRLPARRWLLLAPVWTAAIVGSTGWGDSRFRIGADVAIVVLGAYAIALLSERRHRRSGGGGAPGAGSPDPPAPSGTPRTAAASGRAQPV